MKVKQEVRKDSSDLKVISSETAKVEQCQVPTSLERVQWMMRVFVSAVERFYWDNGFSKAASLAYTTLLSLVPITFVVFGFLASLAISNQDLLKVREFIFRQFVPSQSTVNIILEKLTEIEHALNDSSFSLMALSFFAITALLLINSIEYALNEIWQVFEPRSIPQRISIFCAILVIGPVLLVSAYYTTKLRLEPFLQGIEAFAQYTNFANHIISFLTDFLAFFALYFLVPKAPVKIRAAAFGAAVTSFLFDAAKYYFTVYIVYFSSYDKVYGALAAIPVFLFWLYISWTILLFGCELCYQFQNLPQNGRIWRKQVTSVGDGSFLLACQALILIARAYREGTKAPNEIELCESLGCSSIVLKPVIGALKSRGLLVQGDSRDAPLILQRASETINLDEILRALFPGGEDTRLPLELSRTFAALSSENGAQTTTLASLISKE